MNPSRQAPSPEAGGVVRRIVLWTQRRKWRQAADSWGHHGSAGLGSVVAAVLEEVGDTPAGVVVDVGAGTGALSVPLAAAAEQVVALDVSDAMLARLAERARDEGIRNLETAVGPVEAFDRPQGSVDLVVSNYALHHLLDRDKDLFVRRAAGWLRPGGRLVIGDMMLGRGTSAADREIIRSKIAVLAARGPAGWWRVAKNAWRLMTRTSERPIPMDAWCGLLRDAGFVDVSARRVVAEAAIVTGRVPRSPVRAPAPPDSAR